MGKQEDGQYGYSTGAFPLEKSMRILSVCPATSCKGATPETRIHTREFLFGTK
jgi:hypothetical protein